MGPPVARQWMDNHDRDHIPAVSGDSERGFRRSNTRLAGDHNHDRR